MDISERQRDEITWMSEDERRSFDRDGFLVLREVLSAAERATLISTADRLMASAEARGRDEGPDGMRSFRDCLAVEPRFRELLAHRGTFGYVVGILGPNIHLLGAQLLYLDSWEGKRRTIRVPERHGWHRDRGEAADDLGHVNVPRLSLKVGYYLTDLRDPGAGPTLFAPGSHLLKEPLDIPPGAIDPAQVFTPALSAGDAIVFENRTWHCGGMNISGRIRKCVMVEYGYRWLRRRVDYLPYHSELVDCVGPVERQLLGAPDSDVAGRYVRGQGGRALQAWFEANRA